MMKLHGLHLKSVKEADSEKARLRVVAELTRNDIFHIIRSFYPYMYEQILKEEGKARKAHKKGKKLQSLELLREDEEVPPYHPFQTLFQVTCKYIGNIEPLTITKPSAVAELHASHSQQ